jgi:glyoxylase-like metal-dependent hydrolase (beta-lactamase superfamily II)
VQVLAHPRAAIHLIDPTKLLAGVKSVYGEQEAERLYPNFRPISAERVHCVNDGEEYFLSADKSRPLRFLHVRGHANHHVVIHDPATRSVFTGDAFGVSYRPFFRSLQKRALDIPSTPDDFLFPSTSPIDFNPEEAHLAIDRIAATDCTRVFPTHFGVWDNIPEGVRQMHHHLTQFEQVMEGMASLDTPSHLARHGDEKIHTKNLLQWGEQKLTNFFKAHLRSRGVDWTPEVAHRLRTDIELNAQGLLIYSRRRQKEQAKY